MVRHRLAWRRRLHKWQAKEKVVAVKGRVQQDGITNRRLVPLIVHVNESVALVVVA